MQPDMDKSSRLRSAVAACRHGFEHASYAARLDHITKSSDSELLVRQTDIQHLEDYRPMSPEHFIEAYRKRWRVNNGLHTFDVTMWETKYDARSSTSTCT